MVQCACTAIAGVLIWQSGSSDIAPDSMHAAWQNTLTFVSLGFISFSMGLQGGMARALNTPFGATGESYNHVFSTHHDSILLLRSRVNQHFCRAVL